MYILHVNIIRNINLKLILHLQAKWNYATPLDGETFQNGIEFVLC